MNNCNDRASNSFLSGYTSQPGSPQSYGDKVYLTFLKQSHPSLCWENGSNTKEPGLYGEIPNQGEFDQDPIQQFREDWESSSEECKEEDGPENQAIIHEVDIAKENLALAPGVLVPTFGRDEVVLFVRYVIRNMVQNSNQLSNDIEQSNNTVASKGKKNSPKVFSEKIRNHFVDKKNSPKIFSEKIRNHFVDSIDGRKPVSHICATFLKRFLNDDVIDAYRPAILSFLSTPPKSIDTFTKIRKLFKQHRELGEKFHRVLYLRVV